MQRRSRSWWRFWMAFGAMPRCSVRSLYRFHFPLPVIHSYMAYNRISCISSFSLLAPCAEV
jgi:hypothetical protein